MRDMSTPPGYSYSLSTKSDQSDELINTYLIRPVAGVFVRFLFPTRVTPNQVTVSATVVGCFSALCYFAGGTTAYVAGGLLLSLKDTLDAADGQLARARQQFSRRGRFLDSIGDILVNALVFVGIATSQHAAGVSGWIFPIACIAFLSLSLRVSYHVFYQTSFLHSQKRYEVNRTTEEILIEDMDDPVALRLQRVFQLLYGWQDRIMVWLDGWSRKRDGMSDDGWFGDPVALRWSGLLGLGTELFLLTVCSLLNSLKVYLFINIAVMNGVWIGCIMYRRVVLSRQNRSSAT
jgi:phosphatidylglycerophosphate synthase